MNEENKKHYIMLTRYHKDIVGEPHSFTLKYRSPIRALDVYNEWKERYKKATDFVVFIHEITLWVNLTVLDLDSITESDLIEKAKKELDNSESKSITVELAPTKESDDAIKNAIAEMTRTTENLKELTKEIKSQYNL